MYLLRNDPCVLTPTLECGSEAGYVHLVST